ncbi:MAG: DUF4339 domain-containing protein [Hyphomicrobiaceae bacterium]|nr:DUF4339 domain-containing protein [Hyphomicrobiaceae bacterium]MCC0006888.1 DUF4339 domain-containing protein [Hyphomicrobiaceae bacterium]
MASDAAQPTGWYVSHEDGGGQGPLSDLQMRQEIGRGRIKPSDRVWREGMDEWVEARRIPNYEEVRRTFFVEAERAVRMAEEKQGRKDRVVAQRREARGSTASRKQSAPVQPRGGWSTSQSSQPSAPQSAPQTQTNSGRPGGGMPSFDLEKTFGEAAKKIGKIPQAAIVFFVLGLIFTPALPVFWFIAWFIWSKANKR